MVGLIKRIIKNPHVQGVILGAGIAILVSNITNPSDEDNNSIIHEIGYRQGCKETQLRIEIEYLKKEYNALQDSIKIYEEIIRKYEQAERPLI